MIVGGPAVAAILGGAGVGAGMTSAEMGGLFKPGEAVNWKGFWQGVVIGGISGAISGAVGLGAGALFGTSIAGMAGAGLLAGLAGNAAGQGMGMWFNPEQKWSWSSFIFAGIGGAIGGAIIGSLTRGMVYQAGEFEGLVKCSTSALEWFGAHALGGALGGFVGDAAGQIGANLSAHGLNFDQWTWDWGQSARATALGAVTGVAGAVAPWRNRACFAAGTRLLTPDGDKAIETFVPGDKILSRHERNPLGELEVQVVEDVFVNFAPIFHLHVGGQVIRTTGAHPFWVKGRGWVQAAALRPGDLLSSHDGQWVEVEELFETGESETVYNLRVSEFHTYFVGSRDWKFSVWAHNEYVITEAGTNTVEQAREDLRLRLEAQGVSLNTEQLNELMVRAPTSALNNEKSLGQLQNVLKDITGGSVTRVQATAVNDWLSQDYSYRVSYANATDPSNVSGLTITIKQGRAIEWEFQQGGSLGNPGDRGSEYSKSKVDSGLQKGHIMAVEDGARLNFVDDSAINIIGQSPTVNLSNVKRFEIWRQNSDNGMIGATNQVKVVQVDVGGGVMKNYIQWTVTGGAKAVDVTFNPLSNTKWGGNWWETGGRFDAVTSSTGITTSPAAVPTSSMTTPAYAPAAIRTAYGINSLSYDGTGETIAIVDAYSDPNIGQSVDTFDRQFGATASGVSLYNRYGPASSFLRVLNQYGQATSLPATDPTGGWETEEALDLEWAHAMAPGAQIVLVEANSQSLADLMASVATAADEPGVSVVSMSWGFAEGQSVLAADEARYDRYLTTPAGHQGVTFVASTGDNGSSLPEYPAFSPNVVAVGGTSLSLNADGSYNSESGWGYYSNALGQLVGSGGGVSQYESEPAYQRGVQSTGSRTIPDVSFLADPNKGVWIADAYNAQGGNPWQVAGGTSLSARRPGRDSSPWSTRAVRQPARQRSTPPAPSRRRRRCTTCRKTTTTSSNPAPTAPSPRSRATTW